MPKSSPGPAQADVPQGAHLFGGHVRVAHEEAFGQLELEPGGIGSGVGEDLSHPRHEIGLAELRRADVDRDREVAGRGDLGPQRQLRAGGSENPVAQRHDEARFLGERDELCGGNDAMVRIEPPQQRLRPEDPAGRVDLRW